MSNTNKPRKIKRIKTKRIWPSLLVFVFVLIIVIAFASVGVSVFLQYVIESKYSANYKNYKLVLNEIENSEEKDTDSIKAIIESGAGYGSVYTEMFYVDKDKKEITGVGEYSVRLDWQVAFIGYGDDDGDIDGNSDELFLDANEDSEWLNDNGEIVVPIKKCFKKMRDTDNYDREWMEKELTGFSLWVSLPMPDSGNSLMVKTYISIQTKDVLIIILFIASLAILTIVPLMFMLINVISNVITHRRMIRLMYFDELTGGDNWAYFKDNVKKLLAKGSNRNNTYAVVDLELMKYRSYCACQGVAEGEKMLVAVYDEIIGNLAKKEICVRYARANFAIFIKCANDEDAKQRITDLMEKLKDVAKGHRIIFHSGYYLIEPVNGENKNGVDRKDADVAAIYNSASAARAVIADVLDNAVMSFSDKLLEDSLWEHKVEDEMESALNNKEFEVYYQPKYNPVTNELAGAEALIRWIKPDGIIPPGRFIPIFEKNGFITKIDDYMISNVARQQAAWLKEGRKIVPVSVNVSRAHFTQEDLAEHILHLVDEHDIPHEYIEIELTESAFFDDKKVLLNIVNKLKGYGFEISMDDFGAGYSSLNSLKDLPLDVLKLDAEFFRGEDNDKRAEIVVTEAISLAKQLDMRIVAEGIEKKNQVDFLANVGCDMIQGYYFAKPMPAKDYEERMDNPKKEVQGE